MADLGAIGARVKVKPYYTRLVTGTFIRSKVEMRAPGRLRYVPFYLNPSNIMADPCNGLIAGTTQQDGNPAPFKIVHLFHRPNLIKVRSTLSDANGAFSFPCVAKATTYLAMTLDNATGAPSFNAAIADYITPVPMP